MNDASQRDNVVKLDERNEGHVFESVVDWEVHTSPIHVLNEGAQTPVKRYVAYRFAKRLFDIVFSLLLIVVGFIPGLILSVFIAVDTKGSPLYSQLWVGKDSCQFKILKFRTMVADSDNVEKYFAPEQLEVWKRERKVDDDPRITLLGAVLRKFSVDELLQFLMYLLVPVEDSRASVLADQPLSFRNVSCKQE